MKVTYGLGKDNRIRKKCVVVIGVFDGVHRGHQALIKKAIKRARALHARLVVLTFDPHPVQVLYPERKLSLIISLKYRLKLLEQLGVDETIVVHFTRSFSRLSPEKFIKQYLIGRLHPQEVFVGDDFRFGQNRSGSIEDFISAGHQFGFRVNHIKPLQGDRHKISSSQIRELIENGELSRARFFLGRPVALMGKVVRGSSRGKSIGFPTANVLPNNEIIAPRGVYAVKVFYRNKTYKGAANLGVRPTFKDQNKFFIEVHIFDFHQSLYGQDIAIEFVQKIRDEKKFNTLQELVSRIKQDITRAKAILS